MDEAVVLGRKGSNLEAIVDGKQHLFFFHSFGNVYVSFMCVSVCYPFSICYYFSFHSCVVIVGAPFRYYSGVRSPPCATSAPVVRPLRVVS